MTSPRNTAKSKPKAKASRDSPAPKATASPGFSSSLGTKKNPPLKQLTLFEYQAEIEKRKAEENAAVQEGRAEGLRYYERKRVALLREKKNQTELIFIKAPAKGWYKAFGRSAVYFEAEYGPKIGSKAKVKIDKDYQFQDKTGCLSIPNINALVEKLDKIKVKLVDTENNIYTFKLDRRITAEEYNLMKERVQTVFERANKMIQPKEMMPNLFEDAKAAYNTVFWTFQDMKTWTQQQAGAGFTAELREIIVEYTVMAKLTGKAEEFLDSAMLHAARADGYFLALSPLRIINDEKMLEIAGKLSKLRNQIIFEKKVLATKKIDQENKGKIK